MVAKGNIKPQILAGMFFCCFSQTPSSKATQYEADDTYTYTAAEDAHIEAHFEAHPSNRPTIKESRRLPGLDAVDECRRMPANCDSAAKQLHAQQCKDGKDSNAPGLQKQQWRGEGADNMTVCLTALETAMQ